MAFAEDHTVFFDTADFGVEALFTPIGGVASTIQGIFDDEYIAVDSDGEVEVAGSVPMFQCRTIDVPDAYQGTLLVNGTLYTIVEPKDDGTGLTMLMMEEQ